MIIKNNIVLLLLIVNIQYLNCEKILGLFPYQGKSHFIMFEALMKALAERGHEVDVLSHFPQKVAIPRYKDINVRGTLPIYMNNLTMDMIENITALKSMQFAVYECGNDVCDAMFKLPIISELYEAKTKYDLIVTEIFGTDCMLVFAHKMNIPVVGMISSISLPWSNDRFGNIDNPSFIPNYFLNFDSRMNLFERIYNTITLIFWKYSYDLISSSYADQKIHKKFGNDIPSIYELQNNMSLLLVNSHFSLNQPRPTPPNVIEVAGLHIRPLKELPMNIERVLNNSKNGVILLTMGSMIRTETFNLEKQRALIEAFAELPYTIYWKGERDKFPGPIPENIIFESWLPQLEILCHPNIKLFITHGGLMGVSEAVYCGVPMIQIPFFADQELNVNICERKGIAKKLSYSDLTKETILKQINEILSNSSFQENAKTLSRLFRDRPMSAMDTAIYWIEYVIRHKGAHHLRPANVHLSWYQLYLYDVLLVIICVICLVVAFIYMLVLLICKLFIRNNKIRKEKLN